MSLKFRVAMLWPWRAYGQMKRQIRGWEHPQQAAGMAHSVDLVLGSVWTPPAPLWLALEESGLCDMCFLRSHGRATHLWFPLGNEGPSPLEDWDETRRIWEVNLG